MSDLVGNPEDRFSHNEAHISVIHGANLMILKDYLIVLHKYILWASIQNVFSTNESPQNMFLWRNRKLLFALSPNTLICSTKFQGQSVIVDRI